MRAGNLDDGGKDPAASPGGVGGEHATPNLFDLLRSRVRAASDGQLVLAAALGVAGFVALGVVRRWPWAALAACSALLGTSLWGVLDRTPPSAVLMGRALPKPLITMARMAAGTVALLALLALMLGVFGLCLGTWIS